MTTQITFYNETELNGKYQIKSNIEIKGNDVKKIQSNSIHTHQNVIYKNLNNYWVGSDTLEMLKNNNNIIRTFF